jgi:LysR family glycine cleavage system transcriptional activator
VTLTPQGATLYPGLQAGFGLIRDAVASLRSSTNDNVLVVSTPPGITSKWLAPRLYRFAAAHPEIELRIASSVGYANFTTDGVDVAIRNVAAPSEDPSLIYQKLLEGAMVPVCSPKLRERFSPSDLRSIPLIHDDQLKGQPEAPTWIDWFRAAGVDGGDLGRGLRFSSSDHALEAAAEGAGLLLTHAILAHDELRNGRLCIPVNVVIPSGRSYYFVYPKAKQSNKSVQAFGGWLESEIQVLDFPYPVIG